MSLSSMLAKQKERRTQHEASIVEEPAAEPAPECQHLMQFMYRVHMTDYQGLYDLTSWIRCHCGEYRTATVRTFRDRALADVEYEAALKTLRNGGV